MEALVFATIIGSLLVAFVWRRYIDAIVPICWMGAVLSALVLALLVPFVIHHDGNHTSLEPWLLALAFLPTAILGGRTLYRIKFHWGAFAAVIVGVSGLAYLFYIDHTNQLINYTTWIIRRAPDS